MENILPELHMGDKASSKIPLTNAIRDLDRALNGKRWEGDMRQKLVNVEASIA
jgi:hypothetical protein